MQLRLRYWRERRGHSMRQLGARAGVQSSTVHRIETGRISPTVAMLGKLAKALGIHVRDFFPPPRRRQPKRRRGRTKR
jgi:transcriptional regulator with XRE-family HTH domain